MPSEPTEADWLEGRDPRTEQDRRDEHAESDTRLLVLVVDHEGAASLVVRDDVDLDAALSWLRTAIAHVIELRDGPAPVAPPEPPASGTLAP